MYRGSWYTIHYYHRRSLNVVRHVRNKWLQSTQWGAWPIMFLMEELPRVLVCTVCVDDVVVAGLLSLAFVLLYLQTYCAYPCRSFATNNITVSTFEACLLHILYSRKECLVMSSVWTMPFAKLQKSNETTLVFIKWYSLCTSF